MSDVNFDDDEKAPYTPAVNEEENFKVDLDPYTEPKDVEAVRQTGLFLTRIASRFEQINEALERNDAIFYRRFQGEKDFQQRLRDSEHRDPEPDEGDEWARVMGDSLEQVYGAGLTDFARAGSEWSQVVEYEGRKMGAGEATIAPSKATTGDAFVKLMQQKAKVGTGINVPLYHSGIWVCIETPSNIEISNLRYQLGDQKVQLGMATKGSAFSSFASTITMLAVDFTLDHVSKANIEFTSPTDLKEVISQADIPVLLWGMAMAMYPRGFHYSFPCIADPGECDHVTTRLVQLRRMKWEDLSRITKRQRQHMARMFMRCTEEDLATYRSEFEGNDGRRVWITEEFGVDLKVPTIYEYEMSSRDWIDSIVDMSATRYNEPVDSDKRAKRIERFAMDTTASQYRHWVKGMVVRGDTEEDVVASEDSDAITVGMKSVFSHPEISSDFIDAVEKYISDIKLTAIALPSFECPACKKTPSSEMFHKRFPHLVEIDVVSDFFTLVGLKQS